MGISEKLQALGITEEQVRALFEPLKEDAQRNYDGNTELSFISGFTTAVQFWGLACLSNQNQVALLSTVEVMEMYWEDLKGRGVAE